MSHTVLAPGAVEVREVSWTPYGRATPILDRVDLRIGPGEKVLLIGASGAGKSTLLLALAGVLASTAAGELLGDIRVGGGAGLLVQDPREARVAERAGRDVAFGCENAAMPRAHMWEQVRWALEAVGFPYGVDRATSALSGGEAQRLALASVIAARPPVLLLDEPTAMLDPHSAGQVRAAVASVLAQTGATMVVVEHRLEPWLPLVDRVIVLGTDGRIAHDLPVGQLGTITAELTRLGIWAPGSGVPAPLELPEGLTGRHDLAGSSADDYLMQASEATLVRYPPRTLSRCVRVPTTALSGVTVQVGVGETLAVRGDSGAGKSSLISLLTGLEAPTSGQVRAGSALAGGLVPEPYRWRSPDLARRIAWVPQEASRTIMGRTVADSLLATCQVLGVGRERALALAELLGLSAALGTNPHRISGGEKRRLALASAIAHGPHLIGLDEPTLGQDRQTWSVVAGVIMALRNAGAGVVLSTHDATLADVPGLVDATVVLAHGRVGEVR